MSQEPYPRTERARAGSSPAPEGAQAELERQRAEGDLPGQPTKDAFGEDDQEHHSDDEAATGDTEVPPSESVPDAVAERAVEQETDASLQEPSGGTG